MHHVALTLLTEGRAVHHIALMNIRRVWMVVSMEQHRGVWQGSHQVIVVGEFDAVKSRMAQLADEWSSQPGNRCEIAFSVKPATVSS